MTVNELISKLETVKNKKAIVIIADHKGFDLYFVSDVCVTEQLTDPDEIGWEDDPPKWIPTKTFPTITIE